MKTENKLSDIPHEMLQQALIDLGKVESDSRYLINMRVWHIPTEGIEQCEVCLAGCVMANTYKVPIDEDITPYFSSKNHWSTFDSYKLRALDYFRAGQVYWGLLELIKSSPEHLRKRYGDMCRTAIDLGYRSISVTPYYSDPDKFKQDMFLLTGYLHLLWTKTA